MHVAVLVIIGIVMLAAFFFGAALLGKTGQSGASAFLWVWLVVSLGNGIFGVVRAGVPMLNEIGAFVPIFGIPAALGWYLAYRYGAGR